MLCKIKRWAHSWGWPICMLFVSTVHVSMISNCCLKVELLQSTLHYWCLWIELELFSSGVARREIVWKNTIQWSAVWRKPRSSGLHVSLRCKFSSLSDCIQCTRHCDTKRWTFKLSISCYNRFDSAWQATPDSLQVLIRQENGLNNIRLHR